MFLVSLRFLRTIHVKWFSMGCLNTLYTLYRKMAKWMQLRRLMTKERWTSSLEQCLRVGGMFAFLYLYIII